MGYTGDLPDVLWLGAQKPGDHLLAVIIPQAEPSLAQVSLFLSSNQ